MYVMLCSGELLLFIFMLICTSAYLHESWDVIIDIYTLIVGGFMLNLFYTL
jgi:hypothetical protein